MIEDFMGVVGGLLLTLAVPVGIIWLIISLVRTHQAGETHQAMDTFKRSALGIAIAILVPLFFHFLITSLLPSGTYTAETAAFQLGLGLALGLGAFVLGLVARRAPVVGNGLSVGGFVYVIYIVAVHFPDFSSIAQLAITILALLLVIWIGYWLHFRDLRLGKTTPTLSGISAFGMGLLAFFFSNLVIIYTSRVVTELVDGATTNDYGHRQLSSSGETAQFIVVLALAIVFLVGGLLIRAVRSVSSGLLLAGLLSLIATIFMSFSVGRVAAALVTGSALALLIGFGYYKFSHQPVAEPTPPAKP